MTTVMMVSLYEGTLRFGVSVVLTNVDSPADSPSDSQCDGGCS